MEVSRLAPKIIYVQFKNNEQLCKTLLRVSEYYDNSKFHNKKISYRDYVKWYNETKPKADQPYNHAFLGMFLPGSYFRQFLKNYSHKDLTNAEKEMMEGLKKLIGQEFLKSQKRYAIIVGSEGIKSSTVKHELHHAACYLSKNYEKASNRLIKKIRPEEFAKMRDVIINVLKYDRDVLREEMGARLVEKISAKKAFLGRNIKVGKKIREEFRANLNSFLIN